MSAEERFKAIRERLDAATPGPWFYNSYNGIYSAPLQERFNELESAIPEDAPDEAYDVLPQTRVASVPVRAGDTATTQGEKDAAFIAAAPDDLAYLLDYVAKVEAERDAENHRVKVLADMIVRLVKASTGEDASDRSMTGPQLLDLAEQAIDSLASGASSDGPEDTA